MEDSRQENEPDKSFKTDHMTVFLIENPFT